MIEERKVISQRMSGKSAGTVSPDSESEESQDWYQMFFDSALYGDEGQASVCMVYLQDAFCLVNEEGESVLHIAVRQDHFTYILWMLEHPSHSEATINMTNANGDTPLIVAATCGHVGVMELLLNTGLCDLAAENVQGQRATDAAYQYGNFACHRKLAEHDEIEMATTDPTEDSRGYPNAGSSSSGSDLANKYKQDCDALTPVDEGPALKELKEPALKRLKTEPGLKEERMHAENSHFTGEVFDLSNADETVSMEVLDLTGEEEDDESERNVLRWSLLDELVSPVPIADSQKSGTTRKSSHTSLLNPAQMVVVGNKQPSLDSSRSDGGNPAVDFKKSEPEEIRCWNTKILDKIHCDKLVWAKNSYYSRNAGNNSVKWNTYMPARICDNREGMYVELDGRWPIPDHLRLVEFIGAPREKPATPEKFLVEAKETLPFHENVFRHIATKSSDGNSPGKFSPQGRKSLVNPSNTGSVMKVASQQMLSFATKKGDPKRRWEINSLQNLSVMLTNCDKYTSAQAEKIDKNIRSKAEAYLAKSLEYVDQIAKNQQNLSKQRQEAEEEDAKACAASGKKRGANDSDSDGEEAMDITKFARRNSPSDDEVKLKKDTWISYTHKVFGGRIMHTRIVEVTRDKKRRLVVENGEVLGPNNQIRVLDTMPDGSFNPDPNTGSRYKALRDFKYSSGKSTKLTTIHEKAHAQAAGNKIDLGGTASSGSDSDSDSGSDGDDAPSGSGGGSDSDNNGSSTKREREEAKQPGSRSPGSSGKKKRSGSTSSTPSTSPTKKAKKTAFGNNKAVAPRLASSSLSNSDSGSDSDGYDPFLQREGL